MFKNAIVKTPSISVVNGISSASLGKPIYEKALVQHQNYIDALKQCDVHVTVLSSDDRYPDSCFVEDTALCTMSCAIITHPGAKSRQGEEISIESALTVFYDHIEHIYDPGTIEAGDIMMVGNHFYIGLSDRTNEEGARQILFILNKYGFTGSIVNLTEVLHLKTGLSYLENNTLLVSGEFVNKPEFTNFDKIIIDEDEAYAANCIWVNGKVIIPKGFPKSKQKIVDKGYSIIEVDVSEFQKIDGGLSCLSLRF